MVTSFFPPIVVEGDNFGSRLSIPFPKDIQTALNNQPINLRILVSIVGHEHQNHHFQLGKQTLLEKF